MDEAVAFGLGLERGLEAQMLGVTDAAGRQRRARGNCVGVAMLVALYTRHKPAASTPAAKPRSTSDTTCMG